MTTLFHSWSSLSNTEMRELRLLSNERVRLAKHGSILRGLDRLRAPSTDTKNMPEPTASLGVPPVCHGVSISVTPRIHEPLS